MLWQGIFLLALAAVLIGIMRYFERSFATKRAQAFEQAMMEIGFAYERYGKPLSESERARFRLLPRGLRGPGTFCNIARGRSSAGATVLFDYQYPSPRAGTISHTVALFRWEGQSLPGFALLSGVERSSALSNWIDNYHPIDFDSNPEFSRRFDLIGKNEAAIRQFFGSPVLAFFESLDPSRRWRVEGVADKLLIYTKEEEVKPEDLRQFVEDMANLVTRLRMQASAWRTRT